MNEDRTAKDDTGANQPVPGEPDASPGDTSEEGIETVDDADNVRAGDGPVRFMTTLAPIEHQVGMQVIEAMRRAEVAGVVSSVVEGPDGLQRIISVGLTEEQLGEVEKIVMAAAEKKETARVPCIGFHCRLKQEREDEQGG